MTRSALIVVGKGEKDSAFRNDAELATLDDNLLVIELISGRHEALSVLIQRHSRSVFRAARRILGDSGEAEEVVQQTFLESFQHISEFDPDRGPFVAWLLRRAKSRANDLRDHLNAEHFYDRATLDESIGTLAPNNKLYRQEIEPIIEESLRKLPSRLRRVLELSLRKGHTAEEIGEEIKEGVHVVRRLLYEALRRLRSAGEKRIAKKK